MATTRSILVERVLRLAGGGTPSTNSRFSKAQIAYELNGVLAKLLKAQVFERFKDGQSTPDGAIVATYENIPIERRDNGRCMAYLPVTPMLMPKGMGVFKVYPSGYPEKEYIPVDTGLLSTITENRLLSCFGPQLYWVAKGAVWLASDAVGAGVTSLDMELCVSDIMSIGENEPLPIPADMETDAVTAVLQLLGVTPATVRADDKAATPKPEMK